MHSTADSEIAAERQRDEEERRRRREMRYRRSTAAGTGGAAIGAAILVVLFAYTVAGTTPPGDGGLARVLAGILILGGINMRLRSAASLRSEYRWAEQQRSFRLLQHEVGECRAALAELSLAQVPDRPEEADKRAYAGAYVDGMSGRTPAIPINGVGVLRAVPSDPSTR